MKLFRSLRLIAALIIASASLSSSVEAFNFDGMFKKMSHHAGKAFKSFSHHPVGHMFMQAGKQYAMHKVAKKIGPPAGEMAGEMAGQMFDNAAQSLAKRDHHHAKAKHYAEQGDMNRSRYHARKAQGYHEEHLRHKQAYNDHLEKHGLDPEEDNWDSHMGEHNSNFERGDYDDEDYGDNEEEPYDDEEDYNEDEEYNSDEDDDW